MTRHAHATLGLHRVFAATFASALKDGGILDRSLYASYDDGPLADGGGPAHPTTTR